MANESLKNKIAIVTGASSGIGWFSALKLAEAGARVIAVARREDRLAQLTGKSPLIESMCLDITKDLSVLDSKVKEKGCDVLINNAGYANSRDPIQSLPKTGWEGVFETNVRALISVTQIVLPVMLKKRSGDIINIGSIAGLRAYANGSIYCASKHAVVGITEAWQNDLLGQGIRVMGIHPGMAETEFSVVRFNDKEKAKKVYEGMIPLTGEDIAEAIVWSLTRPKHVNIASMTILPTDQAGVGAIYRRNV